MIEITIDDCRIEKNIFSIPQYYHKFGARISVPAAIKAKQRQLTVKSIRERFQDLAEEHSVLIFPDLNSISDAGFQTISYPGHENDQPFQRLHRDWRQKDPSIFRLKYPRKAFATIYIPNHIAESHQVPAMLFREEYFEKNNINSNIPKMYKKLITSQIGTLINQDEGLSMISNNNGYHARVRVDEGHDMEIDLHHTYFAD